MKITNIEAVPVKLKLKEPFIIANVVMDDMFYVIVKLSTDIGVVGYGEAIPAWEVTGETQFSVIDAINHFCEPQKTSMTLIGEDISTFENAKAVIHKIFPQNAPQVIWGAPSAKAALEQAILDAYGKHMGKPVYELFGGTNQKIPFNEVIAIYPVEETLQRIRQEITRGARIIKLKVGIKKVGGLDNFERDVLVVRGAKELINQVDPTIKLVADANQGFITPERTIEFCKKIEGCLDWLEQPILADNKSGFKKIKEGCNVKLMADESVHSYYDAKFLVESGAIDYINLKIIKNGGMIETLRIADLAEKHGVKCQMGSMFESQIGTAICAHTFLSHRNIVTSDMCTFLKLKKGIGEGMEAEGYNVKVPNKPGFGITVDEKDIQKNIISAEDSITYKMAQQRFASKP